jgi:hypothetical protein
MIHKILPSRFVKICMVIALVAMSFKTFAQENSLDNKLNDTLRGGDKFYAVIAVLVTIFTVLIAYLIYQDVRLKRIENEINSKSKK